MTEKQIMTIENLTIKEAKQKLEEYKQLKELFNIQDIENIKSISNKKCAYAHLMDEKVFIRTVTFYYTGILREVFDKELLLEDVSWIPDTGDFADSLKNGNFKEVEPFPPGIRGIGRGSIVDYGKISFQLPLAQR